METFNCTACGQPVRRSPAYVRKNTTGLYFCNNRCRSDYLRRQSTWTCLNCGGSFYRTPRDARKSKSLFCSLTCYAAYEGGGSISWNGYRLTSVNGKQVRAHRRVMEQHLGRRLEADECVHHIDGDRTNNVLSNLCVMKRRDHASHHNPLTWDIERAKSLIAKGWGTYKVAKELGVANSSIRNALQRRGLTLRGLRGL